MSPQYGKLRPTSGWDRSGSLGHPCKFRQVSRLGSITPRHSSSGHQPNFAALNRGCLIYSAGRPSHWALTHISSFIIYQCRNNLRHCNTICRSIFYTRRYRDVMMPFIFSFFKFSICFACVFNPILVHNQPSYLMHLSLEPVTSCLSYTILAIWKILFWLPELFRSYAISLHLFSFINNMVFAHHLLYFSYTSPVSLVTFLSGSFCIMPS